jgi:predicted Zn-dependent peptidase
MQKEDLGAAARKYIYLRQKPKERYMYQKSTLKNGIRLVTEAIPYVKSVTVGVWVGTGSRNEDDHNHGISHFIEHLMFKGTEKRSAKEIAETVDAVGGQLNAFTAKEYTCYYIKVLDNHLELALDILSDMILASRYAPEDIAREREVVLEEVHITRTRPTNWSTTFS